MDVRYLIIGGGVAGTTAAETIRQRDAAGAITIVSDEPHRLYSRILLSKPNFFLEKIPLEQIWLKTEAWYGDNHIELLAGRRAATLNTDQKIVTIDDGTVVRYEKLLLALGGKPRCWDVPGTDKRGVLYLRTLDDAKAIMAQMKIAKRAAASAGRAPRAVAIGSGFISFEMCDMLRLAGIEVTLFLRDSHYWGSCFDEPSAELIEQAFEKGGVKIMRNAKVVQVRGGDTVEAVQLQDGAEVPCEMVIVGIGITLDLGWIEAAGISTNCGILANEYLETNAPDVWTAGDVAEFQDMILGDRVQLGNWVNAQVQGRTAGRNMAASLDGFDKLTAGKLGMQQREPFKLVSFYTTQGFGINIAFVGDALPAPDRTVIGRGSKEANSYGRIIIKGGKVVGATLINRTPELGVISKLIRENVNIAGRERELGDPAFDLKRLVVEQ